MGTSKEMFMDAHEQLIQEYMEEHPDADWSEAYERTSEKAMDRMNDNIAAKVDAAMDRAKEGW